MQRVAPATNASHELIGTSVVNRDAARASISEIGRVSLSCFAWFVVAYNLAVTHHSGLPLSRKESTGPNWSLGFKTADHISRGGGHSL
jgi:hypothetical protein